MRSTVIERSAVIFAQKGFKQTSINDIAKSMGVSRSAIYYYFHSKDEILDALVEGSTLEAADKILQVQNEDNPDFKLILRTSIRDLVIYVMDRINIFRTLNISEGQLPTSTAQHYLKGKDRVLQRLAAIIEAGIKKGEFRQVDSKVAALGIGGMASIFATQHFPDEYMSSVSLMAETLSDMAVASLENRSRTGQISPEDICSQISNDILELKSMISAKANS
jgi:AcrR family transcriptional regulator